MFGLPSVEPLVPMPTLSIPYRPLNNETEVLFDLPKTIAVGVDQKRGENELSHRRVTKLTYAWTPKGRFHIKVFQNGKIIGDCAQACYWYVEDENEEA